MKKTNPELILRLGTPGQCALILGNEFVLKMVAVSALFSWETGFEFTEQLKQASNAFSITKREA